MTENSATGADAYIDKLTSARGRPAVLKYQFISLRSQLPKALIFAFEGDDDKIVYYQWIRRIRPDLEYEPFPCKAKQQVLELRDMLKRDLDDLGAGVYFFVDRDFDELSQYDPNQKTFMTETYSTENYLVSETVLVELLRNEFHCHARPDVRNSIRELFAKVYAEFLGVSKMVNFRLFVSSRLNIQLQKGIPKKVSSFAVIELDRIITAEADPENLIVYKREPTSEEQGRLMTSFEELDPYTRYRGKFALDFFDRWLSLLADDYSSDQTKNFAMLDRSSNVRRREIVLSSFASKSTLPAGLSDFLVAIEQPA